MKNTIRNDSVHILKHIPTIENIDAARKTFREKEPRDLFYRVATELIELSIRNETKVTVPEALAVLLQTWNKNFYRFHRTSSENQLAEIEELYDNFKPQIDVFRGRSIESFVANDHSVINTLFTQFENILGPVGAAKCLHLLAPKFFPLWDRAIANEYGIWLKTIKNNNARLYLRFMAITMEQCNTLRKEGSNYHDLLKAIDEYNYCTYTLKMKINK